MNIERRETTTIAGSLVAFAIFAILLKINGLSASGAANIQSTIMKTMLLPSADTFSAVSVVLSPFLAALLALVFLVLALSFLASYGYKNEDRRVGAATGIIGALVSVLIFPTIAGVFLAVAFFVSCIFIISLSNTYAKELKKWVFFRTGSNSIGKVLLIFNILIALGIFFSVLSDVSSYQQTFRDELKSSMALAIPNVPGAQDLLDRQVDSALSSPFFSAYFRWLPVVSALGVWVLLEFLRNLVLSNIGGIFTSVLIRMRKK